MVKFAGAPNPADDDATFCDSGVIVTNVVGGAFLIFDNETVSVTLLLVASLSVIVALTETTVPSVPFAKVLPLNVIVPVPAVVTIVAISPDVAVKAVIVFVVVAPLYVSLTVTTALLNLNTG
jgi:hypothetical protein